MCQRPRRQQHKAGGAQQKADDEAIDHVFFQSALSQVELDRKRRQQQRDQQANRKRNQE